MKTTKLLFVFLIFLLCFAGYPLGQISALSLGISPSDWIEPNGLQGQTIVKTFTLSRDDASLDLYFTSQMSGDMTDWIKIENGNNFMMPKGSQQFPIKIDLNIPKTAEKKEYKEQIELDSSTKTAKTGQVGVVLGSLIRIDLTVTDKPFLSYTIEQIEIPQQETGNFVNVVLKILNSGNVEAKPTKATIDVFDKFNTTKLNSFTITDFTQIKGVGSFSHGDINLQLPIKLSPDEYWANISVYQDDKVLATNDLSFDIVKAGTLKKENPVVSIFANKNYLLIGGVVLLVIIIVVVIIIFIFRRKNKKQKPKLETNEDKATHLKLHGK